MKELNLTPLAQSVVKALQKQLQKIDQGDSDLINNIEIDYGQNSFEILMPLYGKFLDEGTVPHMPPVEPIERWISAKGLNLNAWAVAMNIKKFGTEAKPFLFVVEDVLSSSASDEFLLEAFDEQMDDYWNTIKLKFT